MSDTTPHRRLVRTGAAAFEPYRTEKPRQPEMTRLAFPGKQARGEGRYMIRFAPRAAAP